MSISKIDNRDAEQQLDKTPLKEFIDFVFNLFIKTDSLPDLMANQSISRQ